MLCSMTAHMGHHLHGGSVDPSRAGSETPGGLGRSAEPGVALLFLGDVPFVAPHLHRPGTTSRFHTKPPCKRLNSETSQSLVRVEVFVTEQMESPKRKMPFKVLLRKLNPDTKNVKLSLSTEIKMAVSES